MNRIKTNREIKVDVDMDGEKVEIVFQTHAQERIYERVGNDFVGVVVAIQDNQDKVFQSKVGKTDSFVDKITGMKVVYHMESVNSFGDFYLKLVVHTVYGEGDWDVKTY